MLIVVFQVPQAIAVSSDVVAATLMKVIGGFKHWQQQTLDLQVVKWLSLGSVPGSLTRTTNDNRNDFFLESVLASSQNYGNLIGKPQLSFRGTI